MYGSISYRKLMEYEKNVVRKQEDITTELLRKNGDKGGNRLFEDNFINMLQRYPDAVKDKKVFIGFTQQIVIYRTGAAAPLALPLGELSAEQAD